MLWVSNYNDAAEGYTQAGLNYLMALHSVGFEDVDLMNHRPLRWDTMPRWSAGLQRRPTGVSRAPSILHLLPFDTIKSPVGGTMRTGMTVFEAHRLPHWLGRNLNDRVQAMIVPSSFNTEGLRACGYKRPVYEVPHTVGSGWWEDAPVADPNRPFTFTYSGAWVPRKNPMAVLRAYLDAFPTPNPEGVVLAMKTASTHRQLAKAEKLIKGRPDIWLWNEMWTDRQMQWLFSNTDCFVSAHYSEGWGLGPFQAKLLGKPVIYTDWSAVKEFCSEANGDIPIAYKMGPVMRHMRKMAIYQEKEGLLHWACPKHEALVEAMRTMVQKPLGFAERAKAAAPMLREKFGWPSVGEQFLEVIKQLPC